MAKSDPNHDQSLTDEPVADDQERKEELQALIEEAIEEKTKKLKRELDGVHRRNTRLEKQIADRESALEDLKKSAMDKDERFKFELEKREQEIALREHQIRVKENREKALSFLTDNELPSGIVDIIPLDDWEVASAKLETVKGVVDADRASTLETHKKNGGDRPRAGGAPVKTGAKRKSEMSVSEAMNYAREHGEEAFAALPD